MANKAQSNIDFNQKQLLSAVLENLLGMPENPKEGQFGFNSITKHLVVFNGTSWDDYLDLGIGEANGVCPLDNNAKVSNTYLNVGTVNGLCPLDENSKVENTYLNIDNTLDDESDNPVANSVITQKINDIEVAKFPNATIIGNPDITNGNISGFTSTDYLQFPFITNFNSQPFSINTVFTTSDDITTNYR